MAEAFMISLLALWFSLPIIASFWNLLSKSAPNPIVLYFASLFIGCALFCIAYWVSESTTMSDLDRFDLNNDGRFSEQEMTAEAEKAFDDFATGGGSFLATIGCIFTGMWYSLVFTRPTEFVCSKSSTPYKALLFA